MSEQDRAERAFQSWLDRAKVELPPKIRGSALSMALVSGTDPDPKQALELGYILMLGKPLVLVVVPGVQVPRGLAKAADAIVEGDLDDPGTKERLQAVIREVAPDVGDP